MFTFSSTQLSRPMIVASLVLGIAVSALASARTLFVANNGFDNAICGDAAIRCRSISQAVENAVDGDQIKVGPGMYGDLDADGDFSSPGEEHLDSTNYAAIHINKRLTIYSQNGSANTFIDTSHCIPSFGLRVVYISSDNVSFGRDGGGFTIVGGRLTSEVDVIAGNVSVTGNVAQNVDLAPSDQYAFGYGFRLTALHGQIVASGNVAIGNRIAGFWADSYLGKGVVVLDGNSALKNHGAGFVTYDYARHVLTNNRSIGNNRGIEVFQGPAIFLGNTVTGNTEMGIFVSVGSATFFDNSVIGNVGPGFHILSQTSDIVLRRNNIFGNDPRRKCGVLNLSLQTVDARENYWGAPSGPGRDPADHAGAECDIGGAHTVTTRFATSKFPIN